MAASDVDMRLEDGHDDERSDGAAHHSPITVDSPGSSPSGDIQDSSDTHKINILQPRQKTSKTSLASEPSPSSADPASAGAKPSLPPTSKPTKPNSHANGHKARSSSPSPPPPPVRPPPQTVRLDIKLGGPEDYEVDISKLSKDSGQRPPTPPIVLNGIGRDESDDSEPEEQTEALKPKKKRKRVSLVL